MKKAGKKRIVNDRRNLARTKSAVRVAKISKRGE
jgi:hypothetical protein